MVWPHIEDSSGTDSRYKSVLSPYSSTNSERLLFLLPLSPVAPLFVKNHLLRGISSKVPATTHIAPPGKKVKNDRGSLPASSHSSAMTRLGGVPIRVIMPPMLEAKARGMSKRDAGVLLPDAMLTTIGSMSATVPVLLTNAPIKAVAPITNKNSLSGLSPPSVSNFAPMILARPVLKIAPPTTNRPIIMITIGLEKPDKASEVLSIPANASTSNAIRATMSERSFPHTKNIAVSKSVTSVSIISA